MLDKDEMLHTVLDAGKSGAIHAFEPLYSQFPGTYALVAAPANIAAVLGNVLDTEQMTECFAVEDNLQHRAVYQAVLKNPVTQGLLIKKSRENCRIPLWGTDKFSLLPSSGEFPYPRRRSTPLYLYCPQTEGMAIAARNSHIFS